jgi:hypothetical protein
MQHSGNMSARHRPDQHNSSRFGELAPGKIPGSSAEVWSGGN